MKITYKIIISILLVSIWSCQSDKEKPSMPKPAKDENTISISKTQFKLNDLKLAQPDSIVFAEDIVVNGMIDVPPENRAVVNTFYEGYVSETQLLIGNEVKKGDLLIKLQNPEFIKIQQDYVDALANLDFQTAEFNRKSKLFEEKVIAQKVFQSTKNEYLRAKARASSIKAQIQLMNLSLKRIEQGDFTSVISIYAPIAGKISKMDVSQGKFVGQSDRIMEIVNIDHVHLELNVYEKDLPKIYVGQQFEFALPESSVERHPAHVKLIGAEIDPKSRFVKVHAHPDNKEESYVVGMYVTSYFEVNSKTQLALPETAFTDIDNKTYVLKLNTETDSTYVFTKQLIQTTDPQSGYKPLLNTSKDANSTYLVKGVFDVLSGE